MMTPKNYKGLSDLLAPMNFKTWDIVFKCEKPVELFANDREPLEYPASDEVVFSRNFESRKTARFHPSLPVKIVLKKM
jgi:hypothetical protein